MMMAMGGEAPGNGKDTAPDRQKEEDQQGKKSNGSEDIDGLNGS